MPTSVRRVVESSAKIVFEWTAPYDNGGTLVKEYELEIT